MPSKINIPGNRKGLALEATLVTILFVVVFIVLLLHLQNLQPIISNSASRSLCRQSVTIHAGKPLEVFRGSITCSPEHVLIPDSLSTEQGQLHAKQAISRALFTCWEDFGQGKLDLFTTQGVYCNVCNWIDFQDTHGKVLGLTTYLGHATVPYRDISFLDYFSGYETPHFHDYMNDPALFDAKEAGAAPDIDDTGKRYATIFVYARGEDGINRIKDTINDWVTPTSSGTGGRFIGGAVAGIVGFVGGGIGPFLLFGTGPVGWITSGLASVTVFGLTLHTFSSYTDKPQWMAFPRVVPYTPESFQKLGCQRLEVKTQ